MFMVLYVLSGLQVSAIESEISLEVDRLAGQVSAIESVISKGGKVAEKTMLNLIELLMNQLLKLDGITTDGDVKLQRKMHVKRVQNYVETLDVLKIKNSKANGNAPEDPLEQRHSNGHGDAASPNTQKHHPFPNSKRQPQTPRNSSGEVVVTKK